MANASRVPTTAVKPQPSLEADVNDLVQRIQRREVAVFCGAGISRKSGIPIVQDVLSCLLQRLGASAEEIDLLIRSSLPFEAFMEALDGGGPKPRCAGDWELWAPRSCMA